MAAWRTGGVDGRGRPAHSCMRRGAHRCFHSAPALLLFAGIRTTLALLCAHLRVIAALTAYLSRRASRRIVIAAPLGERQPTAQLARGWHQKTAVEDGRAVRVFCFMRQWRHRITKRQSVISALAASCGICAAT